MYTGLNNEEVLASRKKYGTNAITSKKKNSFFKLFIETLADPIIKILLIALAIKTIFLFHDFDWFETIGIVVAILVASSVAFSTWILLITLGPMRLLVIVPATKLEP